MIEAAELGNFGYIKDASPEIYVRNYSTIHRMALDNRPEIPESEQLDNLWIFGPTGVGKSHYARHAFGRVYPKGKNKWWDGYRDEETVVIEDVDPADGAWIAYFLKIWGDKYPFIAEIKGKAKEIRPKRIIVTSNYRLKECMGRTEDYDPLMRRFKEVLMTGRDNNDNPIFS